jgi:hypothetical protein
MKRKPRRLGMGRIFQRKSRVTGQPLPTWWIGYRVPGERNERQESAGTADYDEAKRVLRQRQGDIAKSRVVVARPEQRTVVDVLELVRKDYTDTNRIIVPGHLEALAYELGMRRALDVDREMLDDLCRKWKHTGPTWPGRAVRRQQPVSGATCNHYMATLRRGYNLAREKWGLVTGLTFPHERETARGRYMPPAVFYAIHAHLPTDDIRDVFELAYLTGVRKGQLRATETSNVVVKHVARSERWELAWRGEQTKAGKRDGQPHTVPLTGRALEIVRAAYGRQRAACPFLFHSIKCGRWTRRHRPGDPCLGRFQSEWQAACKVATTITGHRSLAIFKRYGIRQESVQRAALEKVEAYVQQLTDAPSRDRGTGTA